MATSSQSPLFQELSERFLFLIRAAPGAVIILLLSLAQILSEPRPSMIADVPFTWLVIVVLAPALIIAHIAYELFLPILRKRSDKAVLQGCRSILGADALVLAPDVKTVGRWRNAFVEASPDVQPALAITSHSHIRQGLGYLFSSALTAPLVVGWFPLALDDRWELLGFESLLCLGLAFATLSAHSRRCVELGKSIGRAMKPLDLVEFNGRRARIPTNDPEPADQNESNEH